jgi:tetratricopeptide (TPR) repeat protein
VRSKTHWRHSALDPRYEEPFTFLVNHFNRAGELDRVAALYDSLLGQPDLLSPDRLDDARIEQAHILMALGRYKEAERHYLERLDHATNACEPPDAILLYSFNAAEANRRATGTLAHEQWNEVVRVFEKGGASSDMPRSIQANRWQAMHIAFAGIGDLTRAREALEKAGRAAQALGEFEDIFCVKSYQLVPVAEFLTINNEMLAALDHGELWDGMKVPPQTI